MGRTAHRTSAPARRWTWIGWGLYIQCKGIGEPDGRARCGSRRRPCHLGADRARAGRGRRAPAPTTDRASVTAMFVRRSPPSSRPSRSWTSSTSCSTRRRWKRPYVLVGHSIGGLNARLHAARHPDDLAGIVFVDPTSPNYFQDGMTRSGVARRCDQLPNGIRHDAIGAARRPARDRPRQRTAAGDQRAPRPANSRDARRRACSCGPTPATASTWCSPSWSSRQRISSSNQREVRFLRYRPAARRSSRGSAASAGNSMTSFLRCVRVHA